MFPDIARKKNWVKVSPGKTIFFNTFHFKLCCYSDDFMFHSEQRVRCHFLYTFINDLITLSSEMFTNFSLSRSSRKLRSLREFFFCFGKMSSDLRTRFSFWDTKYYEFWEVLQGRVFRKHLLSANWVWKELLLKLPQIHFNEKFSPAPCWWIWKNNIWSNYYRGFVYITLKTSPGSKRQTDKEAPRITRRVKMDEKKETFE